MQSTATPAAIQGFYAFASKHQAAMASGGAGAGEAAGPPRPPAAVPYLEQSRIPVTSRIIACRCGCKSRFCESCCLQLGIKLKQRLVPVLQTFKRVMMLTFTIDPQHFPEGPQEAFEHVKQSRCLSVTMQALRRAGVLLSDRWFAVIEWQLNGWPHWHVLVEANRIEFDTLRDAWNVNLCKLGKDAADTRTGFGSVRFNAPLTDGKHAAGYACAYLTKHPEHGYPDWVLASQTRKVHRYSAARGFWMNSQDESPARGPTTEHDDDTDGEGASDVTAVEDVETRSRRTIREQLATCGETTAILREIEEADAATGEMTKRFEFIEKRQESFASLMARAPAGAVNTNARGTRAELLGDTTWLKAPTPPRNPLADLLLPDEHLTEMDELVHWWGWHCFTHA